MRNAFTLGCVFALAGVINLPVANPAHAQLGKKFQRYVAQVDSIEGALLKKKLGRWLPVNEKEKIFAGSLLVSFPKSTLRSGNGAVELRMLSDIGKSSIYPILETAVALKRNPNADLDVRFERGLIVLTNMKKAGAAKVRLHIREVSGDVTLQEPGTKLVLELYSRHPPGLRTLADLKLKGPLTNLTFLVVKGKAFLKSDKVGISLTEPPGPALVHVDSESKKPEVVRLEKLPEEVKADKKEAGIINQINTCISCVMQKKIGPALDELIASESNVDRLVGVTMAGAVDDMSRTLDGLANPKHASLRNHSVIVLRNWLGRDTGQVRKLFVMLIAKGYSVAQARTVLQLLFGFNEQQRNIPLSYQILIGNLNNSKLGVRQLAHWNLVRLAPAGKDIAYNAAAAEKERRAAVDRWRKLIPSGKLPPEPK